MPNEENVMLRIRRKLRDASNPFMIPETEFRSLYRLSRDAVRGLIGDLRPSPPNVRRRHAIPVELQTKIYVGNLPTGCTDADLGNLFQPYGEVRFPKVLHGTNGYRYGVVHMTRKEDGDKAIEDLHMSYFRGVAIKVNVWNNPIRKVQPRDGGEPSHFNNYGGSVQSQQYRGPQKDVNVILVKVRWSLQSVMNHKSFESAEKDVEFFPLMFNDSKIAQKINIYPGEIADIVVHGLGPYFRDQLLGTLRQCTNFVLGFHESLNKVSQKQQINLTVRFWDCTKHEVCTRYLSSVFVQNNTASDWSIDFSNEVRSLDLPSFKVLQISTDEPRKDFESFRRVQNNVRKQERTAAILDIGSCVLHTINYAFRAGINATGWEIDQFLRALYEYFSNGPSRRENFTHLASHTISPAKFCEVRWLENDSMAQETLEILPHLRNFVNYVVSKGVAPSCENFGIIQKAVNEDNFLPAKLAFFATLASDLKPFMAEFQTDTPMVPFLHSRLSTVLSNLMKRFVKPQVLVDHRHSVESVDVEDENNLLPVREIDLGLTRSEMNELRGQSVSADRSTFRKNCKTCLKEVAAKLRARSLDNSQLIKAVSCFDPSIAADADTGNNRLGHLLEILREHNCITPESVRKAQREYDAKCSSPEAMEQLNNYPSNKERLDHFWNKIFKDRGDRSIDEVMRMVMVLSHGNTYEGREFSVDVNVPVENMPEETLVASRLTYDAVSASGRIFDLEITESLIRDVRNIEAKKEKAKEEEKINLKRALQELDEHRAKITKKIQKL